MRIRLASLVLLTLSVASIGYIFCRGSARPLIGNQSLASLSLLAVALCGGVVGVVGLCVRGSAIHRLESAWIAWQQTPLPGGDQRAFWWILGVATACHGVLLGVLISRNQHAIEDQADYLRVASEVARMGGPTRLPRGLFTGAFTEDNRHPLYVGLLALRPTFEFGKLLSALGSVLVLLSAALGVRSRFGPLAGALVASILSVNRSQLSSGALVACETFLTLLVLAWWITIVRDNRTSLWRWLGMGLIAGLAYQTKASALMLFLVSLPVLLVVTDYPARRRFAMMALLVAGFLVAAVPLLVRNVRVYGNPLHSFNNKLLFADSYDEGVGQPDLGLTGNWMRYRGAHTPLDIAARMSHGLVIQAFVYARSLGPAPLDSGRAAIGALLLALAAAELLRRQPSATEPGIGARGVLAAWVIVFWIFFAWYQPIAASDRFILPLVPPLVVIASIGLVRSTTSFVGESAVRLISAGALLYCVGSTTMMVVRNLP